MSQLLTPEVFDLLVIANIAIGLALAARRFRRDLRLPPPADAPLWARGASGPPNSSAASDA